MYRRSRELLNPDREAGVFALSPDADQLRRELAVLPLLYDSEGPMQLPPKGSATAQEFSGPTRPWEWKAHRGKAAKLPGTAAGIIKMYRNRPGADDWDDCGVRHLLHRR